MHTSPDQDAIARRAHELWEAEGRPPGRHLDHWRQAEQEIAASSRMGRTPEASTEPDEAVPGDADSAAPPTVPL